MENGNAIVFAGIAPHPPIMVPEVGGEAITKVRGSIEAMAEFTRRIVANEADTVVLISPHAPLHPRAFVAYQGPTLRGDFSKFRAPQAEVNFPLDTELLASLTDISAEDGFEIVESQDNDLDHGTAVPLYFLDRNGWRGRVVALGFSFLSNEAHVKFGRCISKSADGLGRRVAFVASGDLSHRLKPDAPAGFNPEAYLFDEAVVAAIRKNVPEQIVDVDQELRRMAGECGYRSMLIGVGTIQDLPKECDVLHYEAPFGVGYLVAQLTNEATTRMNR